MRKDAKIGFAIGGVLLAVLTVYAIVVPKHKKTVTPVNLVSAPQVADASPPGATPADSAPQAVQPPAAPAGNAVVRNDNQSQPSSPNDGNPTAPPTVPPVIVRNDPPKPDQPPMVELPSDGQETRRVPPRNATREHMVEDAPVGGRTYVIKSGQTLSSISSEIYGNPRFWVAIQRENKSLNPNNLKIGETIRLPDLGPARAITGTGPAMIPEGQGDVIVPPEYLNHSNVSGTTVSTPPAVEPMAPPVTDSHSYVVKSGDSLYKIAKTVLGSGRKADALYALNKDAIGPDKTKLKLGLVLRLPAQAIASPHEIPVAIR